MLVLKHHNSYYVGMIASIMIEVSSDRDRALEFESMAEAQEYFRKSENNFPDGFEFSEE